MHDCQYAVNGHFAFFSCDLQCFGTFKQSFKSSYPVKGEGQGKE